MNELNETWTAITTLCGAEPRITWNNEGSRLIVTPAAVHMDTDGNVVDIRSESDSFADAVSDVWGEITTVMEDGSYLRAGRRNLRYVSAMIGFVPVRVKKAGTEG